MNEYLFGHFLISKISLMSNVLCSSLLKLYIDKNLDIVDLLKIKIDYFNENKLDSIDFKYDYILFFDLLNNKESYITDVLNSFIFSLKDDGKIVFINSLISNYSIYKYSPINLFTIRYKYIDNIYDLIRSNNLYIRDSFRINSNTFLSFYIDYFAITCIIYKKKY
jgi:hypothetical protein